mgnify:CR=1 FL=1
MVTGVWNGMMVTGKVRWTVTIKDGDAIVNPVIVGWLCCCCGTALVQIDKVTHLCVVIRMP